MPCKESEYNGHPILEIHNSEDCTDRYPVRLGVGKLTAVMAHADDVSAFIEKHTQSEEEEKQTAKPKKLSITA